MVRVSLLFVALLGAGAQTAAPWFPLEVGNQWIYSYNSRFITGDFRTRRVVRTESIGGQTWFVVQEFGDQPANAAERRFRNDDQERTWELTSAGERLWLDPTNASGTAVLTATPYSGELSVPAGKFTGTFRYETSNGLIRETGYFAPGVGLVESASTMLTGSSGGFLESYDLAYAQVGGHTVYEPTGYSIEISLAAPVADVSTKAAPNCALPCYFAACGLGSPVDPPGTYRPCLGVRMRVGQVEPKPLILDLDVVDKDGLTFFHTTAETVAPFLSVIERSVGLYVAPNRPLPPGTYQVRVRAPDGRSATAPLEIR